MVGEVMKGILSTKEIIERATLGIPKGMKNIVSIYIAFSVDILIRNENMIFSVDILIRNENIIFEERKTKNPFEIILHVE